MNTYQEPKFFIEPCRDCHRMLELAKESIYQYPDKDLNRGIYFLCWKCNEKSLEKKSSVITDCKPLSKGDEAHFNLISETNRQIKEIEAIESIQKKRFKVTNELFREYGKGDVIRYSPERNAFISNRTYVDIDNPLTAEFILKYPEFFEEVYPVSIPQLDKIISHLTGLKHNLEHSEPEVIKKSIEEVKKNLSKVFE